jgi:hypothetical protein
VAREQGIPLERFAGVPVFAAEGLTIQADTRTHIPLFLSKRDLDMAVGNAARGDNEGGGAPAVEMASLESVLTMMHDGGGDHAAQWKDVVLIPSVASRRALLELGAAANAVK